jgi:uncharacterized protein YbcV (DUF1398 family)
MSTIESSQKLAVDDCLALSLAGKIEFPEVISKLVAAGVERYHADYSRQEVTYYWPSGASHIVPAQHEVHEVGRQFDAASVEGAVRQSQRGEHTYREFVRKTMAAGCVGYFVQLSGRRVLYLGRDGDCHVEHFPQAKN